MTKDIPSLFDRLIHQLPVLAADTSPMGKEFYETARAYIKLVERFEKVMGIADKYQAELKDTSEQLLLSRNESERQHAELKAVSARIQSREEELQRSEQKYRLLAENSTDVIWTMNLNGEFTYVSPSVYQLRGYTPDEVMQQTAEEAICPESLPIVQQKIQEALSSLITKKRDAPTVTEVEQPCQDGSTVWTEAITKLLLNDAGQPIGFIGVSRNITERKKTEESLRESEEHFRNLFEHAPVGIFHSLLTGKFLAVNPVLVTMLGFSSPEDLITSTTDMTTQIYVDSSKRPEIMQALLSTDGWVHYDEVLWRRKDGRVISVDMTGRKVVNAAGDISYLEGFIEDITERKLAEQELKENEEKFILIFEETPDPILILDSSLRILEVNRGFEKVFECTNEGIISEQIDNLGIQLTENSINLALTKDESPDNIFHEEMILVKRTGVPFIAEVAISRIIIQSEPCLLIQIHDIDEIRRAHDAVAQVNKKLKILSSITRHDILNRIMVTSFYCGELKSAITDETGLKKLETMKKASDEIRSLIDFTGLYQDLGVTDPSWQRVESVLKAQAIQGLVSHIQCQSDLNGIEIYADQMLEKVLYNLVENSVRHGQGLTTIRLTCSEEGRDLSIWYEDDGGGIVAADKGKIFNKGFGKNTGLGLFLIREILSITGITISETGEPGIGVRFNMKIHAGKWRKR
ncbi:MAG TPA: PAS domain S-box protein [Methanospirillum sp.]|nr:PAS domain S-box protein [Methanospirillum sp.]